MIKLGQGFGILLEIWKITKTVNIRIQRINSFFPYRIKFEDKHVLTKKEAETQEYDKIAFVCLIETQLTGRRTCITQEFRCYLCTQFIL